MASSIVEPLPMAKPRLSLRIKLLTFFAKMPSSGSKLDLEALPDRVKRDLGFLDGRDSRYEDDRLR